MEDATRLPHVVAAPEQADAPTDPHEPRLARGLAWSASLVLCVLLPAVMVVANKSAPVPLALGAVLANLSVIAAGRSRALVRRYRRLFAGGSALLTLGVVAWAVLSLFWSVSVPMTVRGLRETLPELVFGCGLAVAWPMAARRSHLAMLGIGVALAGIVIASEAFTGMPLHHLVGSRSLLLDLKRSSIPPLLLVWPAIQLCQERGQLGRGMLLIGFAALGSVVSHSSASVVAVVVGTLVYGLGMWRPRASLAVYLGFMVALLVMAPWTGTLMSRAVSPGVARILEEQHAKERVAIWSAFEERVWNRPWLGHGFDASFRLGDARPDGTEQPGDRVIRDIHPHNQLLQVWIDFGLVGAIGVLVILRRLGRTLPDHDRTPLASRLAFLASATVMGLVGVQAWDAWWLATLAVAWAAFTVLRQGVTEPASG